MPNSNSHFMSSLAKSKDRHEEKSKSSISQFTIHNSQFTIKIICQVQSNIPP